MADPIESADTIDVQALGHRLYDLALVRSGDEPLLDPAGQPIKWLLDSRAALLRNDMFREVGRVLGQRLREQGITQVVGYGYGSFGLVGAVLGAAGDDYPIRGGFLREGRKEHGRQRLLEGPIDPSEPIVLVDDILNSGQSALKSVSRLSAEGYEVYGVLTLFHFTWSGGRSRLASLGLWVSSLLDLNLRSA